MVKHCAATIYTIIPGSIGARLKLAPGDLIISINDQPVQDYIDYLYLTSEAKIRLSIQKKTGQVKEFLIEKDEAEPLGLGFENLVFDGIRSCNNNCLFCFVCQLPKNQRPSLYIKDDDYRLSFLQGSYITLTNLDEADWERIKRLHLSPLYISVHAVNPIIRRKLLGSPKADHILDQIRELTEAGITVHAQAVICPGINDGAILEETITELAKFWPDLASLAIVPVGLTEHRQNLADLRNFHPSEADTILEMINRFQQEFLKEKGTRFVFAADEWYILSNRSLPTDEEYEDYLQLDNGVGLIRRFLSEFETTFPVYLKKLRRIHGKFVLITGVATAGMWPEIQKRFQTDCPGISLEILPVSNDFFGKRVTVTGLLSGRDIARAINQHDGKTDCKYLIPQITLRQAEDVFLDNLSFLELQEICKTKMVAIVPTQASCWLEWLVA